MVPRAWISASGLGRETTRNLDGIIMPSPGVRLRGGAIPGMLERSERMPGFQEWEGEPVGVEMAAELLAGGEQRTRPDSPGAEQRVREGPVRGMPEQDWRESGLDPARGRQDGKFEWRPAQRRHRPPLPR